MYASIVWMSASINQINELEILQSQFLKYLFLKKYGFYPRYRAADDYGRVLNGKGPAKKSEIEFCFGQYPGYPLHREMLTGTLQCFHPLFNL